MFLSPHFGDLFSLRLFMFLCEYQYLQNWKKCVKLEKMPTKPSRQLVIETLEQGVKYVQS